MTPRPGEDYLKCISSTSLHSTMRFPETLNLYYAVGMSGQPDFPYVTLVEDYEGKSRRSSYKPGLWHPMDINRS